MSFNSNISALKAQRTLSQSTSAVTRSFERLATGLRINRASDDAAGLAIADSLKTDSRLFSQAVRNVNDGISMLNIVNETLESQSSVLTRLVELAEQSASGTLASTQRSALNDEYKALLKEFGRLGDSTKFNGLSLLKGNRASEIQNIILQAGITGGSTAQLSVRTADIR